MRGRRQPTAILEANGALKKDPQRYADRANEPQPAKGKQEMPSWLSPFAQKHWKSFQEVADNQLNVLTLADGFALAMLCEAFADWQEALRQNRKPRAKRSDEITLERAHARFLELQREFGMTPLARSRISVTTKPAGSGNRYGAMAARRGQPAPQ